VLLRTVKSCGPDASVVGVKSSEAGRPDRARMCHIRKATVSNKPDRRGEHDISRQTIAQGMFGWKNINQIKGKGGLCPPLCRDPLRPFFSTTFSWKPADASATDPVSHCPEPELTHGRPALRGGSRGDAGSLLTIGAKNV
jgi:hypothetical protein